MKKICLSLVALLCAVLNMHALDITGTLNNWSQDTHMTEVSPGVYTWTGNFKADEEFKFLSNHDWAPGWASNPDQEGVRSFNKTADVKIVYVDNGETYELIYRPENNSNYADNKFWMAEAGRYTVTVDLSTPGKETMTCVLSNEPEPEPEPVPDGPEHSDAWPMPETLMMVGSAANGKSGTWGLGDEWLRILSPTENENEFSWTGILYAVTDNGNNSEFKFVWGYNWEPAYVTTKANLRIEDGKTYPLVYKPDGTVADNKFNVPVSGKYTIVVTTDEFYPTMKVTLLEEMDIVPNQKLYITGGATPVGWSTGNAIEMITTDNIHFTWTGELLTKDDSCFRFLTGKNWYPTYTTVTTTAESVVSAGTYPIQYDKTGRTGEPAFKIAESGNYTVNVNIDPEVMTMELIHNVPKYESVTMTGTAIEGGLVEMKAVTPSRFVAFLDLSEGKFSFNAVDVDGNEANLGGSDKEGSLTEEGQDINSTGYGLVRVTLTSGDTDSFEILPINSLNLAGNIVPDGTTIDYAGNGVWSSTVTLDKTPPSVLDYPSHQFYFLFNNDEALAVKRHSGSYSVDMPYDSYTGLENIRMNNGTYTISLNMRDFTFGVDAPIDPMRISIYGSSVANGQGADYQEGYAYYYGEQLKSRKAEGLSDNAFYTSGVAIGGNNTKDLLNRYDDIIRDFGKYVIIGLSMGNEGIHDTSDKQSVFNQFRDNMLTLISKLREDGKVPVVVNNYTRSDYNDADYEFIKRMNMLIHSWDVPSFNSLGSIDDGAGHWAEGYIADAFHPNTAGHKEFMYGFVPSLFDALAAEKPLPVRDTTKEMNFDSKTNVTFTPEGTVHSFTFNARVKGSEAGDILTFDGGKVGVDETGKVVYTSNNGSIATATPVMAGRAWHDVALSHYYARGYTALYIDGKVAGELNERFALKGDLKIGGSARSFSEISFWRAGMNEGELTAHHNGDMLKSSLEIYSPMTVVNGAIPNLAQSTNSLAIEGLESSVDTIDANSSLKVETGHGTATFYDNEAPVNIYSADGRLIKTVVASPTGTAVSLSAGIYFANTLRFLVK